MRRTLLVFGCWTFVALFFAAHVAVGSRAVGEARSFLFAFAVFETCAVIWTVWTPLILWFSRRYRLTSVRNAPVHLLLSLAFSLASFVAYIFLSPLAGDLRHADLPFFARLKWLIAVQLHIDMLRYFGVVAIEHVIGYYREVREREAALAEAKLEVLKRQLQPHFLFNTLNSISVLMFENVPLANRMLIRLSELLRAGLSGESQHEISLERELAFLDRYLEIERMRFGERLTVDMSIDDAARGARVPNLILQPLVENAIRHGVGTVERGGTILIRAQKVGAALKLEVRDDGPGMPVDARRGVGLSNTEARLRQLYGAQQSFEVTSVAGQGVCVSVGIPFRGAAA